MIPICFTIAAVLAIFGIWLWHFHRTIRAKLHCIHTAQNDTASNKAHVEHHVSLWTFAFFHWIMFSFVANIIANIATVLIIRWWAG